MFQLNLLIDSDRLCLNAECFGLSLSMRQVLRCVDQHRRTKVLIAKESTTLNSCHSSFALRSQHRISLGSTASIAYVGTISIHCLDRRLTVWEKFCCSTLIANPCQSACDRSGISMIATKALYAFECRCGSSTTAKIFAAYCLPVHGTFINKRCRVEKS